jgi:hypothetical protein
MQNVSVSCWIICCGSFYFVTLLFSASVDVPAFHSDVPAFQSGEEA